MNIRTYGLGVTLMLTIPTLVLALQGRGRPIQPGATPEVRLIRQASDTAYYEITWPLATCRNCAVDHYSLRAVRQNWALDKPTVASPDTFGVFMATDPSFGTATITAHADRGNLQAEYVPVQFAVPGVIALTPGGVPTVTPIDTTRQDTVEVMLDSITTFPRSLTLQLGETERLVPLLWAEGVSRACGITQGDTTWIVVDVSPTGFVPSANPDPRLAVPACAPAPGLIMQ